MATATATAAAAASPSTSSSLLPRRPLPPNSTAARCLAPPGCRARLRTARQVAVSSVSPSPSPDVADEEAAAAPKLGKRVRVTAPVRVYHVPKAPDLDLRGREGVVNQYVGVWKGKRITANRPFRVEFELKLDGQDKPVRFLAHLREDEFEFVRDE